MKTKTKKKEPQKEQPQTYRVLIPGTVVVENGYLVTSSVDDLKSLRGRVSAALSPRSVRYADRCPCGLYTKHSAEVLKHYRCVAPAESSSVDKKLTG